MAALGCAENPEEPLRRNGLGLALQLERHERLGFDGLADKLQCGLAEQHVSRLRRLLEPRGDVDGVAGRQALLGTDDDRAGVDADTRLEFELHQSVPHLRGRAHCSQRVVLVRSRHTEDRHHGVADELLHRPTVPLDDRLHPLEVAREQLA